MCYKGFMDVVVKPVSGYVCYDVVYCELKCGYGGYNSAVAPSGFNWCMIVCCLQYIYICFMWVVFCDAITCAHDYAVGVNDVRCMCVLRRFMFQYVFSSGGFST